MSNKKIVRTAVGLKLEVIVKVITNGKIEE